ncbi:MAG: histidine kinase [Thaumarchaeota archaeon]|nr:histidine kinase [Nitrososphaerota archaeon]
MKTYRILVVTGVGTGGWTSKIAADRVREELGKRGFQVEAKTCMVADLKVLIDSWKPDAIVTLIGQASDLEIPKEVPVFNGISLISGVGMEPLLNQLVEVLKKKS